jgi:hypothetical protein
VRFLEKNARGLAVLFIALVGVCFFWSVRFYTRGHLSMPLDDSFIYFQFARNIAEGRGMVWSPGDGFSSALTSPLYALLLAAGHLAGLRGDLIIVWAFLIGLGCLVASFFILAALSRLFLPRDAHPLAAYLAPLLFVLSGSQAWGYLSGMELGLFSMVMLAALHRAVLIFEKGGAPSRSLSEKDSVARGGSRPAGKERGPHDDAGVVELHRGDVGRSDTASGDGSRPAAGGFLRQAPRRDTIALAAWGCLLSVLRPEGFFLALLLAALLVQRAFARDRRTAWRSAAWLGMVLPALVWLGIVYALTGHVAPASMLEKSYLYDPMITPYTLFISVSQNTLKALEDVYLSGDSPPLFFLLFLFGIAPPLVDELKRRVGGSHALVALWFVVGSLSTMLSVNANAHNFRYQLPFLNLVLLLGAVGTARLPAAAGGRFKPWAGLLALLFVLVQGLNLPRWIDTYGMNSKNIFDQQIAMGKYIAAELPGNAVVGLNDAGAIPYYSQRRCFDIVGLATEGQSAWYRNGPGSRFEGFEVLPREKLPTHFAVYPRWWFNPDIFKEKIFDIHLSDNTICGDPQKILFKADWTILGTGERPALKHGAGVSTVEEVDVADLLSEDGHDYKGGRGTIYTALPPPEGALPGKPPRIADGGRPVMCRPVAETMTVTMPSPGPVTLAGRFILTGSNLDLPVLVGGRPAGTLHVPKRQGWQEPSVEIPAGFFAAGRNEVTIGCSGEGGYQSYHYWFMK